MARWRHHPDSPIASRPDILPAAAWVACFEVSATLSCDPGLVVSAAWLITDPEMSRPFRIDTGRRVLEVAATPHSRENVLTIFAAMAPDDHARLFDLLRERLAPLREPLDA
jgi:hypothetical protein